MSLIIDVSNNNGLIDWPTVARSGKVAGAWLKATEGVTFRDSFYWTNLESATAVGIPVGAYHYARPDRNPGTSGAQAEARNFLDAIGTLHASNLRPVLDFETNAPSMSSAELVSWARAFNRRVHDRTRLWPIFYSYTSFIASHIDPGTDIPIGGGLWLANYGPNDGTNHGATVPRPWRKMLAHQYTSKGRIPGIKSSVDLNEARDLWAVTIGGRF